MEMLKVAMSNVLARKTVRHKIFFAIDGLDEYD